jgi:hypothetical protein
MDSVAAKRLIDDLIGKTVGGWRILGHLGTGKSAVVFRASRDDEERALKVFDPDLVQRAGKDRQLKRISRELSLKDKLHPNLVRVFDGGECPDTGYFFVVMELIDAPNLAEVLTDIPRDSIRSIIAQVADAARFLETLTPHIAHRDIKPDNIAISRDFSHATLLDLGVILPIDLAEKDPSSDGERRFFVGTLRYSPPEFLIRREEYSVDGWRAISFYQLGAVLYDLIMKARLFEEFADPYARLVMAVQTENPSITAKDVPEELILLANNCLSKNPEIRLRYVTWDDFAVKSTAPSLAMNAKERVRRRLAQGYEAASEEERGEAERERALLRVVQDVQGKLHALIKAGWAGSDMFCPIECYEFPGSKAGHAYVVLRIPPSKKLLIERGLSVCFNVVITDEKSAATEISWIACSCDSPPGFQELESRQSHRVFAGVFQDGVVQVAVMDLLYQLLDIAQGVETSGHSGNLWLELPPERSTNE